MNRCSRLSASRARARRLRGAGAGFTLLELLVAAGIAMGVMAALSYALISYARVTRSVAIREQIGFELRRTLRSFETSLRSARSARLERSGQTLIVEREDGAVERWILDRGALRLDRGDGPGAPSLTNLAPTSRFWRESPLVPGAGAGDLVGASFHFIENEAGASYQALTIDALFASRVNVRDDSDAPPLGADSGGERPEA